MYVGLMQSADMATCLLRKTILIVLSLRVLTLCRPLYGRFKTVVWRPAIEKHVSNP